MATVKATPKAAATPVAAQSDAPQTATAAPVGTTLATVPANGSGALALPAEFAAELAQYAQEAAATERPSLSKISLRAGQITYQGSPVPKNNLDVVILSAAYRNVYYAGRFDPNNIVNPNCFALSDDEHEMVPHPNVEEPESDACSSCSKGAWGSDPNGGKGKACKQSRRLLLLPADAIDDPEKLATAELAMMDLPVTSQKAYSNLVNTLAAGPKVPVWATIVNITTVPDAKSQFKVVMTPVSVIQDMAAIRAIQARLPEALRISLTPYDETSTSNSAVQMANKANKKF